MVKSMTGYGAAKGIVGDVSVTIEMKSVNNRYLDTSVRLPRTFLFAEDIIKSAVQKHISRGKVDVFVSVDYSDTDDTRVVVNENLAAEYIEAFKILSSKFEIPFELSAYSLGRMPDVFSVEKKEIDPETASSQILEITEAALMDFDVMRIREGSKLADDLKQKIQTISGFVKEIENAAPETVELYRNRLYQKMSDVLQQSGIDDSRIIAEAAIFADHIAVDEETVRLRSHMEQFNKMLENGSPIGRKMDFLIQEFNREANTIGSKCQNSNIAHIVVDLKSEIEKIREQIQNIE